MAQTPATFSESWYRIANQKLGIRPGVRIARQFFRGEKWHVLQDPFSNQFFRLTPAAHAFVARLRPERSVQEVWEECLRLNPDEAPGQEEALRLITQLYSANLLQYESGSDAAQLFERYRRRRQRETRAQWLNIMFLRIPLFDPDRWLDRVLPWIQWLFSPGFALVWLGAMAWAIKLVIEHWDAVRQQSQGVLAPDNLLLLYAGLAVVKTLHEFGHAAACKRFGGEVHVMGVMMLIFTPLPFVDATASWGFRQPWRRMLVGGAGMLTELLVAALAVFVWVNTGPGLAHSLAYNMMIVASVSTVIFNANPLLRYDGYYLLSDWLGIPNLYQRSMHQLRHMIEGYGFGLKEAAGPARTRTEAWWLAGFGVLGMAYRILVFGGILLLVADRYLVIGLLMTLVCFVSWVITPLGKFAHYLLTDPRLERNRPRALASSFAALFVGVWLLNGIPWPSSIRAPGMVESRDKSEVTLEVNGRVVEVLVKPGSWVKPQEPLVRLENQELEHQQRATMARLSQVEAMERMARQQSPASLKPIQMRRQAIRKQLDQLEDDRSALVLRAKHEGIWVAPELRPYLGRWLLRGSALGAILDPRSFHFTAIIPQTDVNRLFASQVRSAQVRLIGQASTPLDTARWQVLPAARQRLPSAALGWMGGGQVATKLDDREGRQTTEPFFEVRAPLEAAGPVVLLHGRSGQIHFSLDPEPLLQQGYHRLRQLLQSRYQL